MRIMQIPYNNKCRKLTKIDLIEIRDAPVMHVTINTKEGSSRGKERKKRIHYAFSY
jgi:hypothetical protein